VQGRLADSPGTSLKLQTPAGKKLFQALQNYGAYVADDAGWDTHYFCMEKGFLSSAHLWL